VDKYSKESLSMTQFTIQDGILQLVTSALANSAGNFVHTGNYDVTGTLTVDTINVKNIVTPTGAVDNPGEWFATSEEELNGKGLNWAWGNGGSQLLYRTGNRLWSSTDFDIPADKSYKIDNVSVLSLNELGAQITKSKLREVGALKSLSVIGDANVGEFAFFNSAAGRLGINTDQPNGAFSVVENNVEIVFGSPTANTGTFGTYTNHAVSIITDNTPRITVKNDGDVIIGNELTKTGNLTVYGTLKVDNLISDTRIDRSTSLEFKGTASQPSIGKGLVWTGHDMPKQLILRPDPSRFWSSESIEVGAEQAFYVNEQIVLSQNRLGDSVVHSNLKVLGTLDTLAVQGNTTFLGDVESRGQFIANKIELVDGANKLTVNGSIINTTNSLTIGVANEPVYYVDSNEINIGNKLNSRRRVKMFGPVSIGIANPDSDVDLAVKGNVSFAGKTFTTGTSAPVDGLHGIGDICWNSAPADGGSIGWVCVANGTPGTWFPFGAINRQ